MTRSSKIVEALVISPDFTMEDIHKIRKENYERTKDVNKRTAAGLLIRTCGSLFLCVLS